MRYAALFLLAVRAFAQPEGSGAVGGVVVDAASGDPIRKVVVTLTWYGSPRCYATAMTNSAGRFLFESLPPGKYTATAHDSSTMVFAQSPPAASDFIVLAAGERREDVRISLLSRPGSISGTVLDPDGEPVPGSPVWLLKDMGTMRGRFTTVSTVQTNERGEYRFGKVGRGAYYVSTGGQANRGFQFPGQRQEFAVRQFYAGVTDVKRATPVVVQSGEQVEGIDFRLTITAGVVLRGSVTGLPADAAAGYPAPNQQPIMLELAPVGEGNAMLGYSTSTGVWGPDRRFEFQSVAPGRYRLSGNFEFEKVQYFAYQEVDLNAETREVTVGLSPGTSIKGQLRAESGVSLEGVQVRLSPMSFGYRRAPASQKPSPKDGTFTIAQVAPGQYFIGVEGLPKGAYPRSVRVGGKELRQGEPFEIAAEEPGLIEVAIGAKVGLLEGTIEDESVRRRPAVVLVAPVAQPAGWGQVFFPVETGNDGSWKAPAPPGKYKLVAIEPTNESSLLSAADLAARLDRLAKVVEMPEGGGRVEVKLTLVHAAQVDEALR